MTRAGNNRLLWGAVKKLREGEAALRDAVAALNQRDGTNAAHVGTDAYGSTRLLTDAQLAELADRFRRSAHLPPPSRQLAGPRGGRARRPEVAANDVAYLASEGERSYALDLFRVLGWTDEARDAFIARQTHGRGIGTHAGCNAVIAPLERIARSKGFQIVEERRVKRIVAPPGGFAAFLGGRP